MNKLMERYIYDVTRRLPEKDRAEVTKELQANIYDMLPEDPTDEEIKEVLTSLGNPATLAEEYRTNPRYLISPSIYDDYIRTLKWVVPLVAGVVFVVGLILGAITSIQNGMVDISYFIREMLRNAFSMGFSAAFQALAWTTVGYIIADRTKEQNSKKSGEWKVEDLPAVPESVKRQIPLSDSIAELIFVSIFYVLAILFCMNQLPFIFVIKDGATQINQLFSPEFLSLCIPALLVTGALSILEAIVKIKDRKWTPLVCSVVVVSNLVNMVIGVYLVTRANIFNSEFMAYINAQQWGDYDLMRFFGQSISNPVVLTIVAIIVIASIATCISAIYKTVRNIKES